MNDTQVIRFSVNQHPLSGILTTSDSGSMEVVILLHPHPLYGGDMDNPIISILESVFLKNHLSTFRFNFRGVSSSHADFDGIRGATLDGSNACAVLREQSLTISGLVGYSFGGSVALRLALSIPVKFVITLSASLDLYSEGSFPIDNLSKISCPLLMFHGTADQMVSITDMTRISNEIETGVKTISLANEGHFYYQSIPSVTREIHSFISELKYIGQL